MVSICKLREHSLVAHARAYHVPHRENRTPLGKAHRQDVDTLIDLDVTDVQLLIFFCLLYQTI